MPLRFPTSTGKDNRWPADTDCSRRSGGARALDIHKVLAEYSQSRSQPKEASVPPSGRYRLGFPRRLQMIDVARIRRFSCPGLSRRRRAFECRVTSG